MKKIVTLFLVICLIILSLPISNIIAEESKNLLLNGSFSQIEDDDSGLWIDGIKPRFWIFEIYKADETNPSNFKAKLDKDELSVESKTKWKSPLTFIKPSNRIDVKAGHTYEISFEYKTNFEDKIDDKVLFEIAFDTYKNNQHIKNNSKSFSIDESKHWKKVSEEITVNDDFDQILPVFKMNYTKGKYWIRNVTLIEKELELGLESLDFIQKDLDIVSGSEIQLGLDIEPKNYPVTNLIWESSNPEVASVTEYGKLVSHQKGKTVITVKDKNSSLTSSVNINVLDFDKENMLKNSSFEIIENAPLKENTSQNQWHQDVGFWVNDLKPVDWIFERYKSSLSARENFKAMVDSDHFHTGSYSVRIMQKTNWGNSLSFFKPKSRVSVEPNTEYILEAYYKTDSWIPAGENKGLAIQVDAYKANSFDTQIGRVLLNTSSTWKKASLSFKTGPEHTSILPVFRMEHTKGIYWLDDIKLYPKPIEAKKINFLDENIVIKPGQEIFLEYRSEPEKVDVETLVWEVENEEIISLNRGKVKGLKPGYSTVSLCSVFDNHVCDSITIEVKENIELEDFYFAQEKIDMNIDKKIYLSGKSTPKFADIDSLKFVSSNEDIVQVEGSLLKPLKTGSVVIDAMNNGQVLDSLEVNIIPNEFPQIQEVINNWKQQLTVPRINNELSSKYKNNLIEQGEQLYETMNKSNSYRISLWPETKPTHSANMTDQFRKLRSVVIAFNLEGSSLYEEREVYFEIIDGIKFLYDHYGYDGNREVFKGNWWDYQIGSTKALSDILILLDRYTLESDMKILAENPANYVPNAVDQMSKEGDISTGANRTDIGIGVLATGLLLREENKIKQLTIDMLPLFELVEEGDGIYADGSMIQHKFIPYTGGYGAVYLDGLATLLSRLENSPWEIPLSQYEHFYEVLEKGFLPLIYKGRLMAMVQGRGMSRSPQKMKTSSAFGGGYALTMNLLAFADLGPKDFKEKMYSLAYEWIEEQTKYIDAFDYLNTFSSVDHMSYALENSNNKAVDIDGVFIYPKMDRVAYHHEDYGLGISMYSSRVANFESFSGENLFGWYTGDGMIYLYTNDNRQFGPSYWPTVNPYRLPGVTLDTRPLQASSGERLTSSADFVGGAGRDSYASIAMSVDKNEFNNQNLQAYKSYFILDDKVVFIGSDIQAQSNYEIKTIVDNRIFDMELGDRVYVDGVKTNVTDELEANKWVSIESEVYDSKVTYLSLNQPFTVGFENRQGSYQGINQLFGDEKMYHEDYIYVEKQHGKDVQDEAYAYMLVLNQKEEDIDRLYHDNPIKILSQDAGVHALYDVENKVLLINVFKDQIELNLKSLNIPMRTLKLSQGSYVFEIEEDKIISHVSDPSQTCEYLQFSWTPSSLIEFDKEEIVVTLNNKDGQTISNEHLFTKINQEDSQNTMPQVPKDQEQMPEDEKEQSEKEDYKNDEQITKPEHSTTQDVSNKKEGDLNEVNDGISESPHEQSETTHLQEKKDVENPGKLPFTGQSSWVSLLTFVLIMTGLPMYYLLKKED